MSSKDNQAEAIKIGEGISSRRANWNFSGEVATNFDVHASKSIPLYHDGHNLVCELSDFFLSPNSLCYEIGCATGTLIKKISEHNLSKENINYIGIDIESDMIEIANQRYANDSQITFWHDNVLTIDLEPCDLIVCYYTVQFIHPRERQRLINKFFQSLNWGGALIMFEKVRGPDARFQDMLTRMYEDYKLAQGYSAEEVVSKAQSLKGVLEPFSTQGNLDLLSRAGFQDIMTIMKFLCFEGFVAIK